MFLSPYNLKLLFETLFRILKSDMGKIEQAYQENLEVLRNSLLKHQKRQFHKNGVSLDENIQIIESVDSSRNSPSCRFIYFLNIRKI